MEEELTQVKHKLDVMELRHAGIELNWSTTEDSKIEGLTPELQSGH